MLGHAIAALTVSTSSSSAARNLPLGGASSEQASQCRHHRLRRRTIADVLSGERRLMHLRAHVAWVEPVHPNVGLLGGEHVRQLLERGLRRAVATPACVALDSGVGRDVDDGAMSSAQQRKRRLHECERSDDVDGQDTFELVERDSRPATAVATVRECWRC